jgi:putative flippase GtrA
MTETKRFILFVLTGGLAAITNIAARLVFSYIMAFEIAVVLAYVIGMTVAFLLSRSVVFQPSASPVSHQFKRFAIVNVAAAAQVWLVSVGLARLVLPAIGIGWHAETLAHVIGVGSPVITSYFAHRWYSFA